MPNNLPASVGRLLLDLWHDLSDPQVLWQVLVLGLCLALAWLIIEIGLIRRVAALTKRDES